MATITPPRSVHPIEPPIRANLELHHIRQASRTAHKHLQDSLLLNTVWAFQRSISNTKTLPNTEAAMNFPPRILVVAVWEAKLMGSTIYTSIALLLLHTKASISLSHLLLLVSSENEESRIQTQMEFVTRRRPLSSNPCPPSHRTLESLDRLTLREQLLSSAPIR